MKKKENNHSGELSILGIFSMMFGVFLTAYYEQFLAVVVFGYLGYLLIKVDSFNPIDKGSSNLNEEVSIINKCKEKYIDPLNKFGQEEIFKIMEDFEQFKVCTNSQNIKVYLTQINEDLGSLVDYLEKSECKDKEAADICRDYIPPVVKLVNLEREYSSIPNVKSSVPVNVDEAVNELTVGFHQEVRMLYYKDVVASITNLMILKEESAIQEKQDLIRSAEDLSKLQEQEIQPVTEEVVNEERELAVTKYKIKLKAAIWPAICLFLYLVNQPEYYILYDYTIAGILVIIYFVVYQLIKIRNKKASKVIPTVKVEKPMEIDNTEIIDNAKKQVKLLKQYNDIIPDEKVSKDLDDIVNFIESILGYLKKHPGQVSSLDRFLDYYLPTLIDLLEVYQKYDEMPNLSSEMKHTLDNIEDSLKSIKEALINKFGAFYKDEKIEIGADISVLNTLLQQDGLIGNSVLEEAQVMQKDKNSDG